MKKSNSILKMASCIGLFLIAVAVTSCSGDDPAEHNPDPVVVPPVVVTPGFPGPTYADNYTAISGWGSKAQWNLANVHDPSVEKSGEYYYMYQTDASYGNATDGHGHFFYRRSKDLINWEFMGSSMTEAPAWVKDSLNNKRARMSPALPAITNPNYGYWAPCVRKVGNIYRMYYSIVVTNPIVGTDTNTSWTERAFIGLAETNDLASNNWTDKGMVVCSEPDGVKSYVRNGGNDWDAYFKFNAIDPSFIQTPEGDQYLIYGSWHSGIAALKLNPTTGKPYKLKTIDDYGVRIAGRGNVNTNRWQALEGPEIIYNPDTQYYYLFLAYDELSVAYNTRVARSKSILGPYLTISGISITNGADCLPMLTHPYSFKNHTGWVGISHCGIFQNPETKQWFYTSQARLPEGVPGIAVSNAVMMGHVRGIQWTEDGWPVVDPERYAGVPATTISEASFVGTWEQITMNYQYKTIQKSVTLYLTADKKVSGDANGTWSYDSTKKILTINGVKCNVTDAWDWELATRKVTLTYSGLTSGGLPVWGKKVN
ncbi:MAG: arabinan endo-1,5-alpha-L-arabinosidase [Flavobacterium circumlabens]|uniref:Arabinan endo-1,5-alpha-L-arabinosidase n=1 Tax=Flavobacterium circumlabens TaxID=2133765 RepID=A0A4Y7UIB6_9FLAO|nr:arabinan endo-1,5-alpha-L-arabinosidase [Flavobacterium circumlabens]TCN61093.1 arabinan endo-1,5-alpha-L-arabinosidase [Flavobacterium circumlabens]TEB46200.1 arabinan endo-1,5-alpha-L-arabinosidase [Flavobacterium circumlabens]